MQVLQRPDCRSALARHPSRRDYARPGTGSRQRAARTQAEHVGRGLAGDCPAFVHYTLDWRRVEQTGARLALDLARPDHSPAQRQRDQLSPQPVGRTAAGGAVSPSLPASRHTPHTRRVSVRFAPDGTRWPGRRPARYASQCTRLWPPYLCTREWRVSAAARGLSGRMWHARDRRLWLLAVPEKRTRGWLSTAAQPRSSHADHVGSRLSRLRHDCPSPPARRACVEPAAQPRQAAAHRQPERWLVSGLFASVGGWT